ncbi:MAG: hypothetical protein IIZ48_04665 [Erysipelotrichales bacterium]|nr:hypothetical protein [Erysipelotrichales bacterium]
MNIQSLFLPGAEGGAERTLSFLFDGTVEEYAALPDANKEVLSVVCAQEKPAVPLRIVTGLKFDITKNVTSQIIHYKDAFKLENPALTVPFMLYGKKGEEDFAMILVPECEAGYLYAKALYYCLTEKEGTFDNYMNNIVSFYLDPDHIEEVKKSVQDVISGNTSFGWIQRYYDKIYIGRMDHLKELCVAESRRVFKHAEELLETEEERKPVITDAIVRCYLLKKCMYVHYMKAKNLLNGRYGGDIKLQRTAAKEAANAVPFVSYSELWRYREAIENAPKVTTSEEIAVEGSDEKAESPEEFAKRVLGIEE